MNINDQMYTITKSSHFAGSTHQLPDLKNIHLLAIWALVKVI